MTLTLIDGNLRRELTDSLPDRAPNFFFVDIQGSELQGFRDLLKREAPEGTLTEVPMLRGRILALNGEDVTKWMCRRPVDGCCAAIEALPIRRIFPKTRH